MQRRPIQQVALTSKIYLDVPAWMVRRRRLERLASLLESTTEPVHLYSTMECYPKKERLALRQIGSPLELAFRDPVFRREGLAGDSVADGIDFFHLSTREAHLLLCDCGYCGFARMGAPIRHMIAIRSRQLAARLTVGEVRHKIATWFSRSLGWVRLRATDVAAR